MVGLVFELGFHLMFDLRAQSLPFLREKEIERRREKREEKRERERERVVERGPMKAK